MSEPTSPAVFLSYAREDTDAARRIADALRSHGVVVWFDQNELRGGDAWDAKIRKQINDCALFLPIISQHTQERGKGYFRLEWKLAVEQTHLMAEGMTFLAPVVVDETPESGAVVPSEFMRVQWTRLPGALATPQFVAQVKRLLEGKSMEVGHSRSAVEPRAVDAPKKNGIPGWTWGALTAVVVGVGVAISVSRKTEPAAPPVAPVAETKPAAAPIETPRSTDKSIAVIPFTNMSEEKDSAFFADGIHEDILTNLALIRQLRVVSRTSVMSYRATTKPMRQIAQELGVTYILEGSVRRSGNKVRVTGQLIHAATDEHVWAQAYDRDLTDIFAIQSELSSQIAGALKAALSPEEKVLIARRPTENPAAYDLLLRARDVKNREGITATSRSKQVKLLQSAVDLDPSFAQGWGELAASCAQTYFYNDDGADDHLARAKAAIDHAMQLAPDDPEVFSSLGTYYYYGYRDYVRAAEQYERRAKLQPNSPVVFNSLGLIQRRQGHWAESLVNSRHATELDPSNLSYQRNLLGSLVAVRRWDEAFAVQRRIVALSPDDFNEQYMLGYVHFMASGSTREIESLFAGLAPDKLNSSLVLYLRRDWAISLGNWVEANRLDQLQPYFEDEGEPRWRQAILPATALFAQGNLAALKTRLGDHPNELRKKLEQGPKNAAYWSYLGLMEAMLGNNEEALKYAERGAEILPDSKDALDGISYARLRATVYDWTGDREKALAEYGRLLRRPMPYGLNVYELKHGYSTLHGDPRFEALLNDPKNNAPLF